MARKYKRYSEEFKRDALAMSASSDVSDAQLERDLGITPGLLCKWRDRYRIEAESGELKPSEAREAEIRRLKRELAIAREERGI